MTGFEHTYVAMFAAALLTKAEAIEGEEERAKFLRLAIEGAADWDLAEEILLLLLRGR